MKSTVLVKIRYSGEYMIQGSEHGRNGRIGRIGTDLWTYLKKWTYPSIRPCVMDVWDGYGRIRP